MLWHTSLFIFSLCHHVTLYKTLTSLSTLFIKGHVGLLQLLKWPCRTSFFYPCGALYFADCNNRSTILFFVSEICYEQGRGPRPPTDRPCHVPCGGDCQLSPWAQYSPCSQTCGDTPGFRTRSRMVIYLGQFLGYRCS